VRRLHHPGYYFPLPVEHPFPMDKFWRAEALIRGARSPALTIEAVVEASIAQLRLVHTHDYLEQIRTCSLNHLAALKLGLPASEALLTRSRLEVAGTLAAARAALEDGLACNLAGGTHHAFPDQGQGYCVLNDVAIAIRDLHLLTPYPASLCARYGCPPRQRHARHLCRRSARIHLLHSRRKELPCRQIARLPRRRASALCRRRRLS